MPISKHFDDHFKRGSQFDIAKSLDFGSCTSEEYFYMVRNIYAIFFFQKITNISLTNSFIHAHLAHYIDKMAAISNLLIFVSQLQTKLVVLFLRYFDSHFEILAIFDSLTCS